VSGSGQYSAEVIISDTTKEKILPRKLAGYQEKLGKPEFGSDPKLEPVESSHLNGTDRLIVLDSIVKHPPSLSTHLKTGCTGLIEKTRTPCLAISP
jgi:hypothetical protein